MNSSLARGYSAHSASASLQELHSDLWNAQVTGSGSKRQQSQQESLQWQRDAIELTNTFRKQYGMEIGRCNVILHVRPCEGLVRNMDNTVEKRFAERSSLYPVQVCTLLVQ